MQLGVKGVIAKSFARIHMANLIRITGRQAVIRQIRHVGAEGEQLCVRRHDMVSGDIVTDLNQCAAFAGKDEAGCAQIIYG